MQTYAWNVKFVKHFYSPWLPTAFCVVTHAIARTLAGGVRIMAFENVMFSQPVAKGGDLNCFGVICLMYSNTVYLQCSNLKGFTMGQMYPQHFGSRVIKRLHYLWFREVSCIKCFYQISFPEALRFLAHWTSNDEQGVFFPISETQGI